MKPGIALIITAILCGCSPTSESIGAPAVTRDAAGFPAPDRPVAGIVSPEWSSGPDRDAADESGQLIRALGIKPGMVVADIGAGSGYHTLRLSPAVGPTGIVYAEDIVEAYIADLRREVDRRKLTNIRIVIGTAGGTGHVIEFRGPAFEAMSIEARLTVCNMAIEGGARAGLGHQVGSCSPGK